MNAIAFKPQGISQLHAELVIEELCRSGVELFCVSPGARAIPLLAVLAAKTDIAVKLFNDERAAAFYAQAVGKSGGLACLICTTGTASANYFPGIIEASLSSVPLIVLTADRPAELQYAKANQTIDQRNIYGKYCCESLDIPAVDSRIFPHSLLSNIDQIVATSVRERQPVHLNLAYRKPFAEPTWNEDSLDPEEAQLISQWRKSIMPYCRYAKVPRDISKAELSQLVNFIDSSRQPLIISGPLPVVEKKNGLLQLASQLCAPIFADINSGLRFFPEKEAVDDSDSKQIVFANYNLFLDSLGAESGSAPDLILYFGDRIVSEPLREYLQNLSLQFNTPLLMISPHSGRQDAVENEFIYPNQRVVAETAVVADKLSAILTQREPTSLLLRCRELESQVENSVPVFFQQNKSGAQALEAEIVAAVFLEIAPASAVYLAISLVFRQAEYFSGQSNKDLLVCANRGATGIDGILSSALGFAAGVNRPLTLVIGDQSLLHDLNSLALVAESRQPITVVVINNNGGAIFNFFDLGRVNQLLVNAHDWKFSGIAQCFGLDYVATSSVAGFLAGFQAGQQSGRSCLIEVAVDGQQSVEVLKKSVTNVLNGGIESE